MARRRSSLKRSGADQIREGFLTGYQSGARAYQEDRQRDLDLQKKQLEEAELTRRYDLQLRNQAAIKSMELASKAEEFKNQTSTKRRETYNTAVTKNALDALDTEEKYLSDYLKPENVSKVSNASQLRARMKEIQQNKLKISRTLPGDDGFIDETKLIVQPRELVEPVLSEEYRAAVSANQKLPGERLKGTQLRNEKLANEPDPMEKDRLDKLEKVASKRNEFIGLTNSAYATGTVLNKAHAKYGPKVGWEQRWALSNEAEQKGAFSAYEKAKQDWTAKAPEILTTLEDPEISEPDVIQVVRSTKGQYNNLRTFDDFASWIHDLNSRDYSKSPASKRATTKIMQYLLNQGGVQ